MKNYPKYTVEAKKIKGIENETVTTPKLKGFLMAGYLQRFKYAKIPPVLDWWNSLSQKLAAKAFD